MSTPQDPNQPTPPPWAGGSTPATPPGYQAPQGYPTQPTYAQGGTGHYIAPPPSEGRGIGLASMITGIGSIVLAVALGVLGGIVAIILGIIGLRKPAGRTFSIVGIITGAVGIIAGILFFLLALLPFFLLGQIVENTPDTLPEPPPITEPTEAPVAGDLTFTAIDTPCYTFDGPAHFTNNISADDTANCGTNLELWGEKQADGTFLPTGVGAVFGTVAVEPVRASYLLENTAAGTLEEVQAFLETGYLLQSGQSIIQTNDVTLGGAPAKLTFLVPNSPDTQLRAVVAVLPPTVYPGATEDIGLFLITVSTEEDNGDAILESLLNTWTWK